MEGYEGKFTLLYPRDTNLDFYDVAHPARVGSGSRNSITPVDTDPPVRVNGGFSNQKMSTPGSDGAPGMYNGAYGSDSMQMANMGSEGMKRVESMEALNVTIHQVNELMKCETCTRNIISVVIA